MVPLLACCYPYAEWHETHNLCAIHNYSLYASIRRIGLVHNSSGSVTAAYNFHYGQNNIGCNLNVGATDGTVDAFATGRITGIIVPACTTWAYDVGVTGNRCIFSTLH